ncbi:START domain protein [Aphelenchoides avenae]|nr:START domain protein [Aphelenchus avenae]
MVVSKGQHVTLKTEEYCAVAEHAAEDVYRLGTDLRLWTSVVWEDNETKIYSRKSDDADAKEAMLMLVTVLPATAKKLEALITLLKPYRLQWDDMLEDAMIIEKMPSEVYLLRHLVKPRLTLSARESIEIVKVLRKPNGVVAFGSTGTTHAEYPPIKGYVRTQLHLGGYLFEPLEDGKSTRFSMIFHADLNLPGPRFFSSVADRFKPKLMVEKVNNMRTAIATIHMPEDQE